MWSLGPLPAIGVRLVLRSSHFIHLLAGLGAASFAARIVSLHSVDLPVRVCAIAAWANNDPSAQVRSESMGNELDKAKKAIGESGHRNKQG